jgi:hypothetical protein
MMAAAEVPEMKKLTVQDSIFKLENVQFAAAAAAAAAAAVLAPAPAPTVTEEVMRLLLS